MDKIKSTARTLCAAVLVSEALLSCQGKGDKEAEADSLATDSARAEEAADTTLHLLAEEVIPKAADELFNDFFYAFTENGKYQLERINFPLRDVTGDASEPLSREDWDAHHRFDGQEFYSIIFDRESDMELQHDTAVSHVSVDYIHLRSERVERFNFRRGEDGQWRLTDFDHLRVADTPNADFTEFLARFVADSAYQRESLRLPLRLISEPEDVEDEGGTSGTSEMGADEWFDFAKDMPLPRSGIMTNINYGQSAFSENRKTLLSEVLGSGQFVKFRFDRSDGRWRLMEIEL